MLVAVYGTLKRNKSNNGLMQVAGGEFIGEARIGGFEMYSGGGFPVVYLDEDKGKMISIEVFEVQDIEPLDRLEGHPNWYRRIQVDTPLGEAWIYVMQSERYKSDWKLLTSGEF